MVWKICTYIMDALVQQHAHSDTKQPCDEKKRVGARSKNETTPGVFSQARAAGETDFVSQNRPKTQNRWVNLYIYRPIRGKARPERRPHPANKQRQPIRLERKHGQRNAQWGARNTDASHRETSGEAEQTASGCAGRISKTSEQPCTTHWWSVQKADCLPAHLIEIMDQLDGICIDVRCFGPGAKVAVHTDPVPNLEL